jgi:large subunit ribosomal protein L17
VGDNAETALIELVDFNEIYGKGKGESKEAAKKTRRSSSGRKKSMAPKSEVVAETPKEVEPVKSEKKTGE